MKALASNEYVVSKTISREGFSCEFRRLHEKEKKLPPKSRISNYIRIRMGLRLDESQNDLRSTHISNLDVRLFAVLIA